jgi:phage terminase large subunit GpA-like protein
MLDSFSADFDVELADASQVVVDAWIRGWTIPPKLTVSQWADTYRQIAKGAGAEPGQWRTARNPPLREIQDGLSDHSPVRVIDFKKSAQIGATEVGINWTGYVIHRGLDSMIVAQPVKDLSRSWSTTKFEPAVALMPELQEKIEADNTLEKRFPGGTLWIIWTNSSNQLRQRTARFIFMDEVDEYPDDLGDQGGADEQLAARAMSYGDRAKIYRACTPTVAGASKIDAGFQLGDQRYYQLPCPHCGVHQALHRDRLQPDGTFVCVAKGCVIEEHHKEAMLVERSACMDCGEARVRMIDRIEAHGVIVYADQCACHYVEDPPPPDGAFWMPTHKAEDPTHRSYHIWAAYTPEGLGLTWKEIADRRAAADANPTKQAAFDNLICGEVHEGERKEQSADEVEQLAEPGVHRGTVPDGAWILTAGVDWQHDRAEVQIVAWGRGQRGRVVDYAVIDGDPSNPDGYEDLDAYLQGVWTNVHGKDMHIAAVAIDGGNWTEMVAQYVKKKVSFSGSHRMVKVGEGYRKQSVYLVRGRSEKKSERAVYRPSKTEVNQREKTVARSVGIWGVGTSVIKHLIYGWLSAAISAKAEAEKLGEADPIEARMLRFPGGRADPYDPIKPDAGALPPAYYKGLVCEYFDLDAQKWVNPKGARNEPLDTLEYAYWAALSPAVKIDAMRESQWAALEAMFGRDPRDLFSSPVDSRETSRPSTPPTQGQADSRGTQPTKPARRTGWGSDGGNKRGWGE